MRRGFYNFDRIIYRYYQDAAVGREAFKAGEFDIYKEYGARSWMRQHKGPKWDDGRIQKDLFETAVGQGLQAYQLNLRRPKFRDIRVRRALGTLLRSVHHVGATSVPGIAASSPVLDLLAEVETLEQLVHARLRLLAHGF